MGTKLNDETKTLANRWLSLNDDLTFLPVKLKNSETPSNKLNEAENSLRPNSTSPTSDLIFSTLKTPLSSTRKENSKLNFNKLRVKLKKPSLNAETPKRRPRNLLLMPP